MTALSVNWIEPHTSELPPIYCATVGVGIGKTEVAIQVIAAHCLNPTASCMLADNLDDISYTSYACDLALIMQRAEVGLVEAKGRLEERLKRLDGKL